MDPTKRHLGDYEACAPSPSGKSQWRCKVCGRITATPDRECYTIAMWADDCRAAGLEPNTYNFMHWPEILAGLEGGK